MAMSIERTIAHSLLFLSRVGGIAGMACASVGVTRAGAGIDDGSRCRRRGRGRCGGSHREQGPWNRRAEEVGDGEHETRGEGLQGGD
jgi:hypothetical protein